MDWGGIIGGAIGGGAGAVVDVANSTIEKNNKIDLFQAQQQAELQKEIAAHQAKNDMDFAAATQARQQQVADVNAAKQPIIDSILKRDYQQSDDAIAAAKNGVTPVFTKDADGKSVESPETAGQQAAMTPDQLKVIQQAKDNERDALSRNSDVTAQAFTDAGYVKGDTVVANDTKQALSQNRMDMLLYKIESEAKQKEYATDMKGLIADMKMRLGENGNDKVLAHQIIPAFQAKIRDNEVEIRDLRRGRAGLLSSQTKEAAEFDSQITELKAANNRLLHAQIDAARQLGINAFDALDDRPQKPKPLQYNKDDSPGGGRGNVSPPAVVPDATTSDAGSSPDNTAVVTPSTAPISDNGATKVPPATQAARDADRIGVLQGEVKVAQSRLAAAQPGTPEFLRAQGDVAAAIRELKGAGGAVPAASSASAPTVPSSRPPLKNFKR